MGKIESVIYFCDICNEKSMTPYSKCEICDKEVCGKCSGTVNFYIQKTKNYYETHGVSVGYIEPDIIFHKKLKVCDKCVLDKEKLESLFLKDIKKVEEKKGEFKIG
jgi:hypothetical protein